MSKNYATIKELVKNSIKITEKMKIFNVEKQTTETLPPELINLPGQRVFNQKKRNCLYCKW